MTNQNVINVGLDDGHDHIKVYLGTDPQTKKPLQFKMHSRAVVGVANLGDDDSIKDEIVSVNGINYTVNESVSSFENTRFDEYPVSDLSQALVYQALRQALNRNNISEVELNITSGLPVNRFYNLHSRSKNTTLTEAKRNNLLKINGNVTNALDTARGKAPLHINKHIVLCEANAAFYDVCLTDKAELTEIAEETGVFEVGAAVLDIGGRTTDSVVVNPGGRNLNASRSGTLDIGIISLQDNVREEIRRSFNLGYINENSLRKALITGIYQIGKTKSHDINEILNSAKRDLFKKIETFIETTIGDASDLPAIILVGGGSYVLKDQIKQKYHNVIIPDDPEFSNARGFYKILTNFSGE